MEKLQNIDNRKILQDKILDPADRASSIFSIAAYNPVNQMFITTDNKAGFCWMCEPVPYEDEKIIERLSGFLNDEYPNNSIIQFCLFRSPDVASDMYAMRDMRRKGHNDFLKKVIEERVKFIKYHTRNNLVSKSFDNGIVQDLKLCVTFIAPISGIAPNTEEETNLMLVGEKIEASLTNVHLQPHRMDSSEYLRFMQTIVNWSPESRWRMTPPPRKIMMNDRLLSEQIFDADTHLQVERKHLQLGDYYAQTLSARRLPSMMWPGAALSYIGDVMSGMSSIKTNYMVTVNVFFPNPEKLKQAMERKSQITTQQAYGPLLKFVPMLAKKKESFDILVDSMQNGNKPLKISYTVTVFAPSFEKLQSVSTSVRNIWREQQFELMVDDCCQLPMFINSMPFGADYISVRDLFNYFTISSRMAAPIVPIMGEWKGTGTYHFALFSRNGQLMSVSLHDSQTNKNAIISATSGSGKSFMANELLLSYMSEGAQVWVIDAGKSYKKLCDVMKGDFLQFDEASRVCLNPFALIQDYREDEDSIVSLVQNMASASNQLDDFQIAGLKKILAREWDLHHNDMNLDGIAEACKQDEDRRIKDIGEQLFPFTSAGSYGRYFNGANTIDFQNDFTVLELDELNGRRHLRQVVLLQLIYQIQQQVFLGERSRKKIILIDEAWDLLKEGQIASFMESAYRKFRKYNGCCIIATQSINDLYTNPTGVAIAENSATKFLLGQNGEAIESIKATKRLAMSDGCYDLLKTVHTMAGVYSEIFIHSERGLGVGRLIVSEFQKILYSTTPEDVAAVQRYLDKGMSMYEAIQHVLSDRGLQNTVYQDIDTEPLEEEVRYLGTGFGSFEENSPEYQKKFLEDYQEKHPDQEIDLSEFEPQKKKQEAQTEEKTEKKDLKSMLVGYIDKFMLKLGYSKDSQSENKVSQGENSEFVLTTDQKQTEGERVQERK